MTGSVKWKETYSRLQEADKESSLDPRDLEDLALASFLTGHDDECYQYLERAHQGYLDLDELEHALRCAFWLGLILVNSGEKGRGSGWFQRGKRIMSESGEKEPPERGFFLIPDALQALSMGDGQKALEVFERIEEIGKLHNDIDLITLGRLGHGQAMIQKGEISQGISLLDETLVAVETEDVFPLINGIVYCAAIESCRKVWDLDRAQEWTLALTRWCESQPDIIPFRGECLIRRAEIIQLHGDWSKALEESDEACTLLLNHSSDSTTGEAYYRKAEIQRQLGDMDGAEESYQEAAKWGRRPQPGLALLRLDQKQLDAAETSIANTLSETLDKKKRTEILPAVVKIMLEVDRGTEAQIAAKELKEIAILFDQPYLNAISSFCQAAIDLEKGSLRDSMDHLQRSQQIWNSLHLPYEMANTREMKGRVYREMGDRESSQLELSSAQWIYSQLHALTDLKRVNRIMEERTDTDLFGLTIRELQVLDLVATGKTNRSIAEKLFISERTVDRHVSNIFNKLGVSSRVEATSFALKNHLIDNTL